MLNMTCITKLQVTFTGDLKGCGIHSRLGLRYETEFVKKLVQ